MRILTTFSHSYVHNQRTPSQHSVDMPCLPVLFTTPSPCDPVFMLLRTIIIIAVVMLRVYLDIKTPVLRCLDWILFFEKKIGQGKP